MAISLQTETSKIKMVFGINFNAALKNIIKNEEK